VTVNVTSATDIDSAAATACEPIYLACKSYTKRKSGEVDLKQGAAVSVLQTELSGSLTVGLYSDQCLHICIYVFIITIVFWSNSAVIQDKLTDRQRGENVLSLAELVMSIKQAQCQ